jgi:hypothetical protein
MEKGMNVFMDSTQQTTHLTVQMAVWAPRAWRHCQLTPQLTRFDPAKYTVTLTGTSIVFSRAMLTGPQPRRASSGPWSS